MGADLEHLSGGRTIWHRTIWHPDNLAPDNLAPEQFGTEQFDARQFGTNMKRTIWHQEKNTSV